MTGRIFIPHTDKATRGGGVRALADASLTGVNVTFMRWAQEDI